MTTPKQLDKLRAKLLSPPKSSAFSDRLNWVRDVTGLTQPQIAEYAGVSRQTVGAWENARGLPSSDHLRGLAVRLGVSADLLLGISDDVADSSMIVALVTDRVEQAAAQAAEVETDLTELERLAS